VLEVHQPVPPVTREEAAVAIRDLAMRSLEVRDETAAVARLLELVGAREDGEVLRAALAEMGAREALRVLRGCRR
jgi:hypothetical protein